MNHKDQTTEAESFFSFLLYVYNSIHNKQKLFAEYKKSYNKTLYKNTRLLATHDELTSYYLDAKVVYNCIPAGVDFNQFVNCISQNPHYKTKYRNSWFYERHNSDFRQKLGFNKNSAKLKEKDSQKESKKAWREYKKFKKDKSHKRFSNGINAHTKRICNKAFRARVKDLIKNEKFDKIYDEQIKIYLDPWDWY